MTTQPAISIITPTFNRSRFLPLAHRCVTGQTMTNFEWLVLDDSRAPSEFMLGLDDPRIRYTHQPGRMKIGKKRNLLINQARAPIIAHFDDDDYYGPQYLSRMLELMGTSGSDIVKLFGAYHYSRAHDIFAYWDYSSFRPQHMVLSDEPARWMRMNSDTPAWAANHLGYGFSYVFRRQVWEDNPFPEVDWNEDRPFIEKALEAYTLEGIQDVHGTCLHILHGMNSSRSFPQYILPRFLLDRLFPDAKAHLAIGDEVVA